MFAGTKDEAVGRAIGIRARAGLSHLSLIVQGPPTSAAFADILRAKEK
jgi:hypothetical protein